MRFSAAHSIHDASKDVSQAEARQYLIDDDHAELAKNIVGHRHEPTIIASGIRVAKTL